MNEQELEIIIERILGKKPINDIVDIVQELCNGLMIQTNGLLQENLYQWENGKIKDYAYRIQCFSYIVSALMSIKRRENDFEVIAKGFKKSEELFESVVYEFNQEFRSSNEFRKKQIIDELFLSHLSLKWFLKKYMIRKDLKIKLVKPKYKYSDEYYSLIKQSSWQKEFLNFRGQTIQETEDILENWIVNEDKLFPSLLRFIDLNGKLIGFIANTPAGYDDELKSGFKMLVNFGISEKYQGKGLMTIAMKKFLAEMKEIGFNIVSAFVRPNNIASEKVLEKNNFDLVRNQGVGKSYVIGLNIDKKEYKHAFGL